MPIVVDGEIVSLDAKGVRSFSVCRSRKKNRPGLPYAAFDLLYADGTDAPASTPLEERKALLERRIAMTS